jgi:Zn-finger nucleic acid-binding protein
VTDPFRTPAAPSRPCPRCEIGLGSRHVLDAVLDECADCTGVFVPIDLVPRLVDPLDLGLEVVRTFAPGEPESETTVRYLRCPRCASMMNRRLLVRGSNVVVDFCKGHGVWFDAHELRRVAELGSQGEVTLPLERDPVQEREAEREAYQRKRRTTPWLRSIEPRDRGTLLANLIGVLTHRFRR